MTEAPATQIPGIYRRRVGDVVVTAISDGYVDASFEMMRDIAPQDAEAILRGAFRPAPPRLSVNAFVIHAGGRAALIDTGAGASMGPLMGRLANNLELAGIAAGDIDTLMLTHLHPDHSNGLTAPDGTANFPEVELVISETDVTYRHDDAAMAAANERHQLRYFQWAREQIAPYMGRRRDAKGEVFPNVTAVPLPGHTPGHTGYRIDSAGESLLIWGDIVHIPDVQVEQPQVYVEPDADPALAVATRRATFEMVAREGLAVAGMHMHFPGFLHLTGDAQKGYRLWPEMWKQDL